MIYPGRLEEVQNPNRFDVFVITIEYKEAKFSNVKNVMQQVPSYWFKSLHMIFRHFARIFFFTFHKE